MSVQRKLRGNCPTCGKQLRKPHNQYCSNACQQEYDYQIYIARWKLGLEKGERAVGVTSNYVRRYMIRTYGEKCGRCGWNQRHLITGKVPLDLHHIDGDSRHNIESNLILLCPNCHALTPTFRNLNIGRGRAARRKV